ncbi:hypothetical protein [Methyloglobulus sp.]|uniref:hypothetical protein n=1 Tax=Methyloglobulus sp. TaxID=2518622 RepID=UPI0032B82D51
MRKLIVFYLFTLSIICYADKWTLPSEITATSPDAQYFIKVIPGNNYGKSYSFEGAKINGYNAEASLYKVIGKSKFRLKSKFFLKNPVAPVDIYVNNQGKTITLDNWSNLGYGAIWVIYQTDGKVIKEWGLKDLYSDAEIDKIQRTVSSIWWRCDEPKLDSNTNKFTVKGVLEHEFSLDLSMNTLEARKQKNVCKDSPF